MPPAHQGLEADDLAADPGLRLVVQCQLAAFDRRLQVVLQRAALAQPLVHRRLEEAVDAAAFGLGAIERGVGVGDQRCGVLAIGREDRDADADCAAKLVAVDVEFLGDGRDDLPGHRLRCRRLFAVGRDDGELIAAEPRHERAADRFLQAPRNFAKQVVADDVAEHVVDFLEAIEVERHQRE